MRFVNSPGPILSEIYRIWFQHKEYMCGWGRQYIIVTLVFPQQFCLLVGSTSPFTYLWNLIKSIEKAGWINRNTFSLNSKLMMVNKFQRKTSNSVRSFCIIMKWIHSYFINILHVYTEEYYSLPAKKSSYSTKKNGDGFTDTVMHIMSLYHWHDLFAAVAFTWHCCDCCHKEKCTH